MKTMLAILAAVSAVAILQTRRAEAACDICGSCLQCQNDGTCQVVDGTAFCFCRPGWRGTTCNEIDPNYQIPIVASPCTPNPCQNNGHCNPYNGGYTCTCVEYKTGTNCEESTDSNPCELAALVSDPCPGGVCNWFPAGGHYCT